MNNNKPKRHGSPLIKKIMAEITPEEKQRVANKMLLAARLDDLMQEKGWGKSQFAEKVDRNPSEITKWLSGLHNFTLDTLTDISLAFGLSLSELYAPQEVQVIYKTKFVVTAKYTQLPQFIHFVTPIAGNVSNNTKPVFPNSTNLYNTLLTPQA